MKNKEIGNRLSKIMTKLDELGVNIASTSLLFLGKIIGHKAQNLRYSKTITLYTLVLLKEQSFVITKTT